LILSCLTVIPAVCYSTSANSSRANTQARLTRATALAILKKNTERLLRSQYIEPYINFPIDVALTQVKASPEEISGTKPVDYSHLPKGAAMDGKVLDRLAKAGIVKQMWVQNKTNHLGESYMWVHYNVVSQPLITPIAQFYSLKVGEASFSGVTGILQQGGAAQIEATISIAPTPIFVQIKGIVNKLLQEEGITETDLRAKYDFYGSRSFCLDVLTQSRKLVTQGKDTLTYMLVRYDDGWRVAQ